MNYKKVDKLCFFYIRKRIKILKAHLCVLYDKLDVRASHPTRFINGLCC